MTKDSLIEFAGLNPGTKNTIFILIPSENHYLFIQNCSFTFSNTFFLEYLIYYSSETPLGGVFFRELIIENSIFFSKDSLSVLRNYLTGVNVKILSCEFYANFHNFKFIVEKANIYLEKIYFEYYAVESAEADYFLDVNNKTTLNIFNLNLSPFSKIDNHQYSNCGFLIVRSDSLVIIYFIVIDGIMSREVFFI